MKSNRIFSIFMIFLTTFFLIVLVGCSNDQAESDPEQSDNAKEEKVTSSEYPIVIKHAFGETVINKKPERVATIAWANHDVALALGVVPVGFSAANYGVQDDSGMLPWTSEKLKELGVDNPTIFQDTDGLDFEAISDTNPDVILAAYSGITREEYDMLSQIAPVIAYPEIPWVITWRDQILYNAKGMGMEEEGRQLIADTEKLIAETANKYPEIKGKKAAFAMFTVTDLSKFYVYTPVDPRGEFLEEIGMEYPEGIKTQITDNDSFYIELSAEHADMLHDTEIFIAYGDENTLEVLQADSILGKVPAIKNGSVVIIGDNTPLAAAGNPNPLSIAYTIDEYLSLIQDVAKKLK